MPSPPPSASTLPAPLSLAVAFLAFNVVLLGVALAWRDHLFWGAAGVGLLLRAGRLRAARGAVVA